MALVIINPEVSSNTDIDNFNVRLSKLISEELTKNNISNYLVRNTNNKLSDTDRDRLISSNLDNNSIIITNGLGSSNIEIIYPLNRSDILASRLATNLSDKGYNVNKYYQKRNSVDTSKNYDSILNSFTNNDNIIIRYGNLSDTSKYNINDLASIVSNTLKSVLGLSNDTYIVKYGDNLYSIARKYNTTVDKLKKYNNLTSNTLSIGQKLYIPATSISEDKNNYYIVKSKDNLYSIARKYNTSVDMLKKINNLTSNVLSIGQKLIIPSDNYITHKVVKGDTLYSLANTYNTTVKDIMNINNLNKTNLSINQILKIPK